MLNTNIFETLNLLEKNDKKELQNDKLKKVK